MKLTLGIQVLTLYPKKLALPLLRDSFDMQSFLQVLSLGLPILAVQGKCP